MGSPQPMVTPHPMGSPQSMSLEPMWSTQPLGSLHPRRGCRNPWLWSTLGRSEVHLGSIWGRFDVDPGFGVDVGSGWSHFCFWSPAGLPRGSRCADVLAGYVFRRASTAQLLVSLCNHPAADGYTHFSLHTGDAAYEFHFEVLPLLPVRCDLSCRGASYPADSTVRCAGSSQRLLPRVLFPRPIASAGLSWFGSCAHNLGGPPPPRIPGSMWGVDLWSICFVLVLLPPARGGVSRVGVGRRSGADIWGQLGVGVGSKWERIGVELAEMQTLRCVVPLLRLSCARERKSLAPRGPRGRSQMRTHLSAMPTWSDPPVAPRRAHLRCVPTPPLCGARKPTARRRPPRPRSRPSHPHGLHVSAGPATPICGRRARAAAGVDGVRVARLQAQERALHLGRIRGNRWCHQTPRCHTKQ